MKDKRLNRAVEIQDVIRQVLFEDWDPIGINDCAPRDEYDAYIGGIYRLLVSGGTEDELCEHLRQLETTQMGSPTNEEHRRMVANKLMELDVSLA
jgi:hypothetical protein